MNTKSVLLSKTVWVQILAVLSLLIPQVKEWLAANPVEFLAALAAVNVLVRFVTSGRISIFGEEEAPEAKDSPGLGGPWLVVLGTAGLLGAAPPSCTPADVAAFRGLPIKGCVVTDHGAVCYSSKGGLSYEVDTRSGK